MPFVGDNLRTGVFHTLTIARQISREEFQSHALGVVAEGASSEAAQVEPGSCRDIGAFPPVIFRQLKRPGSKDSGLARKVELSGAVKTNPTPRGKARNVMEGSGRARKSFPKQTSGPARSTQLLSAESDYENTGSESLDAGQFSNGFNECTSKSHRVPGSLPVVGKTVRWLQSACAALRHLQWPISGSVYAGFMHLPSVPELGTYGGRIAHAEPSLHHTAVCHPMRMS